MRRLRLTFQWVVMMVLSAGLLGLPACDDKPAGSGGAAGDSAAAREPEKPADALELIFTYGSEKKAWVKEATAAFNAAGHKTPSGRPIFVTEVAMGSGETVEEILSGRRQSHLISPASGAFVKLGNAQSRAATGKDLLGPTDNLVLSPTIIAMWKPMAEAMGWPGKPIGWADIIARAQDPNGWGTVGHPEWGRFKLGHTHPEFSNSGLQAVFAIVYAAAGKLGNLTLDDVAKPETARFMNQVQSAIQHYGSSTGFFNDKMIAGGPGYLSAAVLYENLVIEANQQHRDTLTFPLVAIYPKEGTFWADHPVGIVDREWVTPEHREAAKAYIQYLLDRPQQQAAMKFGFRPADPAIPLGEPLVAANGVDPRQPTTTLEVPSPEVMQAAIDLWKREKKKASLVLVFDTSGSMKQENRMAGAKAGAIELLKMLGEEDTLSLLPFSSQPRWAKRDVAIRDGRTQAIDLVNNLIPDGGTALYNSIDEAYRYLQDNPQPGRIAAVVVLTDGEDTAKQMKLDELLKRLAGDVETRPVRVFTIGYGADANEKVLRQIADVTRGKYYKGDPKNIRDVFKDIATFF